MPTMFVSVSHAALAWFAVLSTPASCALPDRKPELHAGERGEPDVHEEEQDDREQDESFRFPANSVSRSKFVAGVPLLNNAEAIGLSEGKGVDTASSGELADAQLVIVMMNDQTSEEDLDSICAVPPEGCLSISPAGDGYLPWFTFVGNTSDVGDMINLANVGAHAKVVLIEYVQTIPQDDVVGVDSSDTSTQWGLSRIGADERGAHGGRGINIYMLDSGVKVLHDEFNGRATAVYDFLERQECNNDLACAPDLSGHGTMCASFAAGQTVGVAPGASVWALKVCGFRYCWNYISAWAWLVKRPDRSHAVASMSFGTRSERQHQVMILDWVSSSGVIMVVAAGNSREDACDYAEAGAIIHPGVIAVGGLNKDGWRSQNSCFGWCIDVYAPSDDLRSASHRDTTSYIGIWAGGTSAACPHVSGAVALILELNPNATHLEVKDEMISLGEKDTIPNLSPTSQNLVVSTRRLPGLFSSTAV